MGWALCQFATFVFITADHCGFVGFVGYIEYGYPTSRDT